LKAKPTFSTETAKVSGEKQTVGFQTTNVVEATNLIRGSAAWGFEVGTIPSIFHVFADGKFTSGYIMMLRSIQEGATTTSENFHFDRGVSVAVALRVLPYVSVSAVSMEQSLPHLLSSMLSSLGGLLLLSVFFMYIFEAGKSWRMKLRRYIRRKSGFSARYVQKLRAAFLNMSPKGRDETEVCGYMWAQLAKDFFWRISEKQLYLHLHDRCSSVSLGDIREAVCEFNDNGLFDYLQFCELLKLLGLLPRRRLTHSEANTYWRGLQSEHLELNLDAGNNMSIGTGVFSDLPDLSISRAKCEFVENLESSTNVNVCHDWVTDLIARTSQTRGLADETSAPSTALIDVTATRASQSLVQGA